MERLTKKLRDGNFTCECGWNYFEYGDGHLEIFNKLGRIEDLEDELGIPLEVLFKALKDGFWFKDSGRVFFGKQAGVFNGVSGTYWFSGIDTMVKVKDYGKTWWLEEPKEELE